jgi:GT2 family glycosyltransferase
LAADPRVSVIIPNWNGAKLLPTCLDALRNQTLREHEVILVDNASRDDSCALVERNYPEVHILRLSQNLGLTGGCNAGIGEARGEVIALLNNDTEADARWLEELLGALERHPEAGSVATKIRLFDRRNVLNSAGDIYGRDGLPNSRGVWQEDRGQFDEETWVFGACGGAVAYRREMLRQIGLFDESFFMYCEDVDLAWRAQVAGWRCIYAPRAVIYHRLSATGGGVTASFYTGRNTLYVLAKDVPASIRRRYGRRMLAAQIKIAWKALRAWRGQAARARLRGQLAGLAAWNRMARRHVEIEKTRRISDEYLESILS